MPRHGSYTGFYLQSIVIQGNNETLKSMQYFAICLQIMTANQVQIHLNLDKLVVLFS
jgi:hypothetical protein